MLDDPMLDDPSINTAIAAILEKALNYALKYDPATRTKLSAMHGNSLQVKCTAPELAFVFTLDREQVQVYAHTQDDADVVVSGSASDFISLMGQPTHSLADSDITISGKIGVLNQLKSILSDLDIDWEEPLTEILGVIPGHALAESIRTSIAWAQRQKQEVERALPEYLTEELKATPSKAELHAFYEGVDNIRSATQRLEARIQYFIKNEYFTKNADLKNQ